jgi:hypothetical protein
MSDVRWHVRQTLSQQHCKLGTTMQQDTAAAATSFAVSQHSNKGTTARRQRQPADLLRMKATQQHCSSNDVHGCLLLASTFMHNTLVFFVLAQSADSCYCCTFSECTCTLPCFLQAMKAFLAKMNISNDQLIGRPILVDLILAYHFVPGVMVTSFYEQNKADESKQLISR